MSLENLTIERIIIHEVFARGDDRAAVPPLLGNQVLALSRQAKVALQQRITSALGASSHGVEMAISNTDPGSAFRLAEAILACPDQPTDFIRLSQALASGLAAAQTTRRIPGGIVVVMDGRCNHPSQPFVAVIKAEPHAGFSRRQDAGSLSLDFIEDLILTPQAKLYKIGLFLCDREPSATHLPAASAGGPPQGWRALLYDHLISLGNQQAAAHYFYSTFLGLDFAANSAHLTQLFHRLTTDFIRTSTLKPERKIDLLNALTTYLKTDHSATIQVQTFAASFLGDGELADNYLAHMHQQGCPATAIAKDLREIQAQLRFRKITFANDIKLIAPADQFDHLLAIETIQGEADSNGIVPTWTRILVRDQIQDQS